MTKQVYDALGPYKLKSDVRGTKRELADLKSRQAATNQYAISPDSVLSIQDAVDNISVLGGGRMLLRNGTYLVDSNITIPDNVTLEGETVDGVIIDFQNTLRHIVVAGTFVDDTGTCSVNNGSASVVGVGTSWTSDLVDSSILLKGRWFVITGVADGTHLTIESPLDTDSISGQDVVIAIPTSGVSLNTFTVENSNHPDGAVTFEYVSNCSVNNVSSISSTIGFKFNAAYGQEALDFYAEGCGIGLMINNSGVWTLNNFELYGSATVNLLVDSLYNASISNATLSSASGNNVSLAGCASLGFYDMENTTAGAVGIEMVSCMDIEVFAMAVRRAGSDGIKLTSGNQRVSVHNVTMINNAGYGLNIADNTNDRNTITASFFKTNTAGTLNNSGTNTINANNQT